MPFDGNGNWSSTFSAVADRDANIKILASRFDNIFIDDIKNAFDNCITRDGQGKTVTNLNANNYKVINVANPTNNQDAVNLQTLATRVAASVGSSLNPVYTDASGNITASNSTVGTTSQPVYLNAGVITACGLADIGKLARPVSTASSGNFGYVKFADGLIIQWGYPGGSYLTPFTTTTYGIASVPTGSHDHNANIGEKSTTGCSFYYESYFIAIGY